jgi:hypothetical protein
MYCKSGKNSNGDSGQGEEYRAASIEDEYAEQEGSKGEGGGGLFGRRKGVDSIDNDSKVIGLPRWSDSRSRKWLRAGASLLCCTNCGTSGACGESADNARCRVCGVRSLTCKTNPRVGRHSASNVELSGRPRYAGGCPLERQVGLARERDDNGTWQGDFR